MEWPNPQPGQKGIPKALNGQRLECPSTGDIKAKSINAEDHIITSK